jgi:hypothetical protein
VLASNNLWLVEFSTEENGVNCSHETVTNITRAQQTARLMHQEGVARIAGV